MVVVLRDRDHGGHMVGTVYDYKYLYQSMYVVYSYANHVPLVH